MAGGEVFHLKLIGRLLKLYGDPDWEFVDGMGEGVPLGLDEQLPRTPAVLQEKANGICQMTSGQGSARARITGRSTLTWRR